MSRPLNILQQNNKTIYREAFPQQKSKPLCKLFCGYGGGGLGGKCSNKEDGLSLLAKTLALCILGSLIYELPSLRALECILHNCRRERNRAHALCLHSYIWRCGLLANEYLGNLLVSMLVEAGCTYYAQQAFDELVYTNECAWNALIIGYAKIGELQHAIVLYHKMQLFSVPPSGHAFVALLKVCSRLKDMERGYQMHSDIAERGLERDLFVGSTLVDMYANFGFLAKAKDVFEKLLVRDAVSWSTLIAALVKHGHGKEALRLLEEMRQQGISPTTATFVCALKACGITGDTHKGQEIHADVARIGLIERDPGVGNTVVDMYATLGLLGIAQEVFDTLSLQDTFSWTALIGGYAKHGYCKKALELFEEMQADGVSPDVVAFLCGLHACGSLGDAGKGQNIHAEIARRGFFEREIVLGNALIDMYASCGLMVKAEEVFDTVLARDVVSWTALIAGYTKDGDNDRALENFEQMQHEGIAPSSVTFVCGLQACGNIGAADKGQEIHAEIARKGLLDTDILIGNALVDMYANCGLLVKARELFDRLSSRDVASWNVMVSGYTKHGYAEEALTCFEQMLCENVDPNAVTYAYTLKACRVLGAIERGQEIHAEITQARLLEKDLNVGNALVDMYVYCGLLEKALEVFKKLPKRDVFSWTAVMAGYVRHGCFDNVLNSFEEMRREGVSPNATTFACVLKACGSLVMADKGGEIHAEIISNNPSELDLIVGNTLIDMYGKCGLLERAQVVFDELPAKDQVTWNALIAAYSQVGEVEKVFHVLDQMKEYGYQPDMYAFVSVFNACSHAGLVGKGILYYEAMDEEYGIIPNLEHMTCMVDLLGRAGQLNAAVLTVHIMPCHPSLATLHTLLSACRKSGHIALAEQTFVYAMELDKKNVGAHVTMLNIYADVDTKDGKQFNGFSL